MNNASNRPRRFSPAIRVQDGSVCDVYMEQRNLYAAGMPVNLLVQIDRSKLATENNGPTELYWALWKADPAFQNALKRAGLGVVKIDDKVWEVGSGS